MRSGWRWMFLRYLCVILVLLSGTAWAQPVEAPAAAAEAATSAAPTSATGVSTSLANQILPRDLSVWGMFSQADWVVQAVMIGLAFASIVTWTAFVAKTLEIEAAVRRQRRLLAEVNAARTLGEAPADDLVAAAGEELRISADVLTDRDGVKERVASRLERLEAAMGRHMLKGTGILATIGATAPFVGLFGTVWGIMN
ncbi:MAG: MotA/TolQ/ExbB proton channel family protein, partial [Proteobacteria bacterium]|nr:MotA/TolQ/ExbB proton channel family protein [Pseudomonadota bacterium]